MYSIIRSIAIVAVCVYASSVAQAAPSYSVTPLVIDEEVTARDIIEKTITLTNTGEQPVTVYPSVNNIAIDEGGGITEFIPAVMSDRTQSLAAWVEISRAGVDMQPGDTKTLTLTLRIHPEPLDGTYHAFIGFGYGRNRDEAEAQVKRGDAPGTVVTVTVADKKTVFLKLSQFVVDRFITGINDRAAEFRIKNPGDEALTPQGEIIIYDSRGTEVTAVPLNAEGVAIAPGEEHTFTAPVSAQGLFGKYKAYLDVEYGTTQRASVQDTAFFYALPFKLILPIFAFVIILVIGVSMYVHKKYYDVDDDGSERIHLHVRETLSESKEHDINLTTRS